MFPLMLKNTTTSGRMVHSLHSASGHYYDGNHRGVLKSFNMKQFSENWVFTLYITCNCVMSFNPQESKVFQSEGTHIQSGNALRGGDGGRRGGAFCNLLYRVGQVK